MISVVKRLRLALVSSVLAVFGCGGGSDSTRPTTPTPASVAVQRGDNQTGFVGQTVADAPAVKVVDASSKAVPNVAVTFAVTSGGGSVSGATTTTGADGIATVSGWTLGTVVGVNTLSATVSGTGIAGNPVVFHATAQLTSLTPASNVSLSGNQEYASVDIPVGVTVTASGNLTIHASGAVSIAGSIVGNCVGISVIAGGVLSLKGSVNNPCPSGIPQSGAPPLKLVGAAGYTIDATGATSSGDVRLTTDTTLTDADFAPAAINAQTIAQSNARAMRGSSASTGVPCSLVRGVFLADPATMPNGTDSKTGTPGQPGHTWIAECRGDMTVTGIFTVTGQSGGNGGAGTDIGSPAAEAVGGKGGDGGLIKVRATGDLTFAGSALTRVTGGTGGDGGVARAQGAEPDGTASATGGAGGAAGLVEVRAAGTITLNSLLDLRVGNAGDGGSSFATSGDGRDGTVVCTPRSGAIAIATGGAGGSTPNKVLQARNVVGNLSLVTVTGGVAGDGGTARGVAGNGGAGAQPCKAGGTGGVANVNGGKGGDALLRDINAVLIKNGGDGGSATFVGGVGGKGWSDCAAGALEDGGVGGTGGIPAGNSGLGGVGLVAGAPGGILLDAVGNGGKGGDGFDAGGGGPAAPSSIGSNGIKVVVNASFTQGASGTRCPLAPRLTLTLLTPTVSHPQTAPTEAQITVHVDRSNYVGPVTFSYPPPDAGVTVTPASPVTLLAGESDIVFTVRMATPSIGDHLVVFTASTTVSGKLVTGQGTLTVHTLADIRRYSANIVLDQNYPSPQFPDPDHDGVEPGTGFTTVHSLTIQKEFIGTIPKITITGFTIAGVPAAAVRSGSLAFDGAGNFLASMLTSVPVTGHGTQACGIDIAGTIAGNGAITFTITINPTVSATFAFRTVKYVGNGFESP